MKIDKTTTEKQRGKGEAGYSQVIIGQTTFNLKYTQSLPQLVDQTFDELLNDIANRGILAQIIIKMSLTVPTGSEQPINEDHRKKNSYTKY